MNTQIIVFDLFNTLIEIKQNHYFFKQIYRASRDRFNLSNQGYKRLLLITPIEQVFAQLSPEFKELYNQHQLLLKEELASISLFPETLEVLTSLSKHHRLFLISNLSSPYKQSFYNLGLAPYFEKAIFSCDCGWIKPQQEIFQLIEHYTGKPKQDILMIGDSQQSDIMGAKKMRWPYLRINRTGENLKKYEINTLKSIIIK